MGLVGLPGRVGHIGYRVQWVAVVMKQLPAGVLPNDWLLGFPSFRPFCIFIKVAALDVTCCIGTLGHISDVVLLRPT